MPKHILVIDDEEPVRDAFELALDGIGYSVETAASGQEGLEKCNVRTPDLIFLDLKMPGIDGVETLRQLHDSYSAVPVYIVTAFYQEYFEPLKQLAEKGIPFQVAQKPLGSEQIRQIARGTLEGPEVQD
jgi:CheY-like chemotaxis protein